MQIYRNAVHSKAQKGSVKMIGAYLKAYMKEKGIKLAVYRREFDGSFVEIGSEIENGRNVHVTDPHPALDYGTYIVCSPARYCFITTSNDIFR